MIESQNAGDYQLYRCGWCGTPTDKDGHCLTPEEAQAIEGDWDDADRTTGDCCPNGDANPIDHLRAEWDREMRKDAFGE